MVVAQGRDEQPHVGVVDERVRHLGGRDVPKVRSCPEDCLQGHLAGLGHVPHKQGHVRVEGVRESGQGMVVLLVVEVE
eukprot:13560783-Heterocapsa_arctica.AAC.1